MWRPIARWPFQTWPVVVDPVVDDPNGANFKKGLNATLRHYTLHSNAHTTNYRTPVMIVILQSSHPAQSLSATASNNQFAELPPSDCKVVSVISATAPWFPKLSGSDKISFNERRFSNPWRSTLVHRKDPLHLETCKQSKGKTFLVLGAIDGMSSCPPSMVAREM